MSTPTPAAPAATGAPESTAPAPEAPAPTGGAPEGTETPPQPQPEVTAGGRANAPAAEPTPEAPVEDEPKPDDTPADPASDPEGGAAEPSEVDQLPAWAQKHIRELREENKRSRLETKQSAVEEATKAAREQMAQDLGRALGIIPPEGEEGGADDAPLTAEQLTELLAAERTSTQTARVELAVFKAAGAHSADPGALLDSRSFLDAVKGIDPTDAEAINKAIEEAVANNPRLKLAEPTPAVDPEPEPTPPPSGGTFAGGPSGRGNDVSTMSIDDFRKQYKAQRAR